MIRQFLAVVDEGKSLGTLNGLGIFMRGDELNNKETVGQRVETLMSTFLGLLTVVAGLAFLIYFMMGAIQWITSNGEAAKIEKAKTQMTTAGMGMVAVIATFAIAGIVSLALGIDILRPGFLLENVLYDG